jgi:hypothetical protein
VLTNFSSKIGTDISSLGVDTTTDTSEKSYG